MKLKTSTPVAAMEPVSDSGIAIADRFKLDMPAKAQAPAAQPGVSKIAATVALLATLAAMAIVGAVCAMLYISWDAIALA